MSGKIDKPYLAIRERISLWLILWAIELISPWEFRHQQDEYIDAIRELLKETP